MIYSVDVWGGDLHQQHVENQTFDDWSLASAFMQEKVDAGLLCNVLDADFACPPERIEEQKNLMLDVLKDI